MNDKTDRLVDLEGNVLAVELTPDEARRRGLELARQGISHHHQRYAGERTGWNSVSGFFSGGEIARLQQPA